MNPTTEVQQRNEALAKANFTRVMRRKLKTDLANMSRAEAYDALAGLMEYHPEWIRTMRLGALMTSIPKIGHSHVNTMLHRLDPGRNIHMDKRIHQLNNNQRMDLVFFFEDKARDAAK